MTVRRKRWISRLVVLLGVAAVGGVVAIGAVAAHDEHVALTQVHVAVRPDGTAQVTEVIDYDFANESRHGIFRDVPDLVANRPVRVSSDAPDDVVVTGQRIRIGDPDRKVSGQHRYRITYELAGVAPEGRLRLDAVGTGWEVPISRALIVVTGPFDWSGLRCDQGGSSDRGGCTARQSEPGRLRVDVDGLKENRGVSLFADGARAMAATPGAGGYVPAPGANGPAIVVPAALGALVAAVAGFVVAGLVQRAGAEWVGTGGAADAAFADSTFGGPRSPGDLGSAPVPLSPPPGFPDAAPPPSPPPPGGRRRIDAVALQELSTIEFAPPPGVSAAQGGVILVEGVSNDHKVAWLIEAASNGLVDISQEGKKGGTLTRTDAPDRPLPPVLAEAFGDRNTIELGSYDKTFAGAWEGLGAELDAWRKSSGLWDPAGDRRRVIVTVLGVIGIVAGALGALAGGASGVLVLVLVSAAVVGAGIAAAAGAWELRVRTPVGSALWLRVESFRRFLAESEAQHVEWAAQQGLLRQYTAWAVAVGEAGHWQKVVEASTTASNLDPVAFQYGLMAHSLTQSTSSTSTAPSSSGGGVGGGAGGGGGGSW